MISTRIRFLSQVRVGLLSRRDAILTPIPTPFESAYQDYRSAIDREHARPFQKEFYFKKGTPPEAVWDNAVSEQAKLGPVLGGLKNAVLLQAEEMKRLDVSDYIQDENECDYSDAKRRKRDTVYFFERHGDTWRLPVAEIESEELMHETAARVGGEFGLMHFVVGKMCVAHKEDVFYMTSRLWDKQDGKDGGFFTRGEIEKLGLVDACILNILN